MILFSFFFSGGSNIFTNSAPLGRVGHRVAMSVCVSVVLCVCGSAPSGAVFFEASHWPSDHMTVLVLLSASVKRVGVSRMRDFLCQFLIMILLL